MARPLTGRTSQIMARMSLEDRAEFEALAALNDVSLSELMRDALDYARNHLRKTGEEAANRRANLPHGVTRSLEEEALEDLVTRLNAGEPILIKFRDILTPASKALYRFLSLVWQEQPGENSSKTLEKIAVRVNDLLQADPRHEEPIPPRDVRSRPRREK